MVEPRFKSMLSLWMVLHHFNKVISGKWQHAQCAPIPCFGLFHHSCGHRVTVSPGGKWEGDGLHWSSSYDIAVVQPLLGEKASTHHGFFAQGQKAHVWTASLCLPGGQLSSPAPVPREAAPPGAPVSGGCRTHLPSFCLIPRGCRTPIPPGICCQPPPRLCSSRPASALSPPRGLEAVGPVGTAPPPRPVPASPRPRRGAARCWLRSAALPCAAGAAPAPAAARSLLCAGSRGRTARKVGGLPPPPIAPLSLAPGSISLPSSAGGEGKEEEKRGRGRAGFRKGLYLPRHRCGSSQPWARKAVELVEESLKKKKKKSLVRFLGR